MLRVHLTAEDLGRIRFADAPAPILESALMLFELRNRPYTPHASRTRHVPPTPRSARPLYDASPGERDWRGMTRSAFPATARPLLNLVPTRQRVLFLDVLTPNPEDAFEVVRNTAESVHADSLERIARMKTGIPDWLYRYCLNDVKVLDAFDQALRTFYASCLAPHWSWVTAAFYHDVTQRMTTIGGQGVTEMINTLSPDLRLNGLTVESRHPREREIHLSGHGLILMPSAFWTGYPLCTWDPQDPTRHVLIYPARRSPARTGDSAARDSLAALIGPTRAAVLRALRIRPSTTSGIARQVGISLPSASEHAATLREAGLITSQRRGQAVQHDLTHLGRALLF